MPDDNDNDIEFPPGLLGEIAMWVFASSPYPNKQIALVTAIAFLSAITSRAYNTYTGAGLNQYILLLAGTGMGKEAVATATGKLIAEIAKASNDTVNTFKGPSHIASVQALIKWLNKHPAILCVFGEFGQKLKAMAKNSSPNDTALLAGYLEVYSKSGAGGVIDPMAYSDKDKNTEVIHRAALTIIGETVPCEFYSSLDESLISNGLLPRFAIFEVSGKRPYLNASPDPLPPALLTQKLADLAAQSLSLAHNNNVHIVPPTDEAKAKFGEFERWTTDQINSSGSEVGKQLWNRANLKALKLASVYAIGINYLNPVLDIAAVMWATDLIAHQTHHLIGKFERDEVGSIDGNEGKQAKEVMRVLAEYYSRPFEALVKYKCIEDMHAKGIVTHSYLAKRLSSLPTFAKDRRGSRVALNFTVQQLLADDVLREVPSSQMIENFGCKPRAYAAGSSKLFQDAVPP